MLVIIEISYSTMLWMTTPYYISIVETIYFVKITSLSYILIVAALREMLVSETVSKVSFNVIFAISLVVINFAAFKGRMYLLSKRFHEGDPKS